jgi:hypothetical protein
MYPGGELTQLAARKVSLRARIAQRRWECVQASAALARPLGWLDRVIDTWRRISPVAKIAGIPLGLALARKVFGGGRFAAFARFMPLVFQTARVVSRWRA